MLGIPTKIMHGMAEIVSDVKAVTAGSACQDIGSDALAYAECYSQQLPHLLFIKFLLNLGIKYMGIKFVRRI